MHEPARDFKTSVGKEQSCLSAFEHYGLTISNEHHQEPSIMTSIYRFTFALWLLAASPSTNASIDSIRATANRIRKFDNADPASYQTSTMTAAFPDYGKLMRAVGSDPAAAIQNLTSTQATLDAQLEKEENAFDAFVAGVESLVLLDGMSMPLSEGPSDSPSFVPSGGPTGKPTSGPTSAPTPTKAPSATDFPSGSPSVSVMPSSKPSATPSLRPSGAPTMAPVTAVPTLRTTQGPVTASPTDAPTNAPTHAPTLAPTNAPTNAPTPVPTNAPTNAPTPVPTVPLASAAPTVAECGITQEVRSAEILAILDANAADPALIRDNSTSQGMATEWLIEEDSFRICPDSPKLLQRWAMAVIYYSTGGDDWFQCSDNPAATDNCGADVPFEGAQRFLGNSSECDWAGISCLGGCVTEIEFGTCHCPSTRRLSMLPPLSFVHAHILTHSLSPSLFLSNRGKQPHWNNSHGNWPLVRLGHLGHGTWKSHLDHSHRDWALDESHFLGPRFQRSKRQSLHRTTQPRLVDAVGCQQQSSHWQYQWNRSLSADGIPTASRQSLYRNCSTRSWHLYQPCCLYIARDGHFRCHA